MTRSWKPDPAPLQCSREPSKPKARESWRTTPVPGSLPRTLLKEEERLQLCGTRTMLSHELRLEVTNSVSNNLMVLKMLP
jgi:hypothetical protein